MPFDFVHAMEDSGIESHVAKRMLSRFLKYKDKWFECIDHSFIREEQKQAYKKIIEEHLEVLMKD